MEANRLEKLLQEPFSYTGERSVYLEIADYRLFADPYGPHHPGALGKIFMMGDASGPFRDRFHGGISYIKSVEPYVFDKQIGDPIVPVHVYSQVRVGNEIVLLVRIENRPHSPHTYDFHKHHGTWLCVVLYLEKWWTAV